MARAFLPRTRADRLSRSDDHHARPSGGEAAARADLVAGRIPRSGRGGLRVRHHAGQPTHTGLPSRTRTAKRAPVSTLARPTRTGAAIRDRSRRPICRLLRQRRTRMLSGARLANARAHPRSLHRISGPDQRPRHASGERPAGALAYFGLDAMGATEKEDMRALVLRGGPWTADEQTAILDYCESDVVALERLLPAMVPGIDLPRALLRGRYMAAAAAMEDAGTPIDVPMLEMFRRQWTGIQDQLIAEIDADYSVFDGRTFKAERFAAWLAGKNIPWPLLESGHLDLTDDTFRQQARSYPFISPLRELRSSLSDLRLNDLAVGSDGRNRTILSAFRSRTGRNQPSNSKYIFGPSVWLRGLIKPPRGHGIAYVDWSQQEFGIAAALSGDLTMQAAYHSGDPYLAFAKPAGAVPPDATKATHGPTRELFKQCVLAVQYGMEAQSLALRIAQPPVVARDLLRAHHETYRHFWGWSDAAVDQAMLLGVIHTVFGWPVRISERSNHRSLRNFPMQANGAEMLRIACCLATERGIEVCAPIHDAVLICVPLDRLDADIA